MSVKIIIDDAKGLYQQGATSGGVVGLKQARSASGVAAGVNGLIVSDAITIPANSLITAYHVVVTSALTLAAAAKVGSRFGNLADGTDGTYLALNDDDYCAVGDNVVSLAAGAGNSSDLNISASLDVDTVNTRLVAAPGEQKIGTSDVNIYGALVSSENITAGGTVKFIIEFITFE